MDDTACYFDIDVFSRKVTAANADAQLWFDRGLTWCYAYCHEEAVACFRRALEADPGCAMAQWGIAYASGPNYNFPWVLMDPGSRAAFLGAAYDATQAALALADGVTPVERALIEALQARYPQRDPIEDQSPWNDAFADAMREVWRDFHDDLEVTTIFAEAIMNRTPWQMWDLKAGIVAEGAGTEEARHVLEGALNAFPRAWDHPGILHLYVHLMEMSPFPEKALKAGDRLRELVPDAGHLIHMPTHIDILCGHYHNVLAWNQKAIVADRKYVERVGPMTFYAGYRLHNYHFAIYGALFLGQYEPALAAAEELIAVTPEELLRVESPPMGDFLESYLSMKQHVYIRFGKWREIIAEELPQDRDLYCNLVATIHYAKGVAHAALGEVAEAERERELFLAAKARVPESRLLHNNRCIDLLEIADAMLAGEIEYRKGKFDAAFAHLRRSVEIDDNLPYVEPWGWIQPTRHALGALLLEQGRVEEAEAVYREDLGLGGKLSRATIHPDNVWSLRGLHECLERRGMSGTVEARLIAQRLDLAAARADTPVNASCFCAQAAMNVAAA
ncbi:MAG: tetratricopeptide repeat protein [Pseudomonadota bacterium]|nr:tetratricopeptide repeat protein [Pseudomonadota bacterium]